MMMMHELLAQTAQKLSEKGVELPVFASPTIAGVTLHDTDLIYGEYRERMIRAQAKHLEFFKERMRGGLTRRAEPEAHRGFCPPDR